MAGPGNIELNKTNTVLMVLKIHGNNHSFDKCSEGNVQDSVRRLGKGTQSCPISLREPLCARPGVLSSVMIRIILGLTVAAWHPVALLGHRCLSIRAPSEAENCKYRGDIRRHLKTPVR